MSRLGHDHDFDPDAQDDVTASIYRIARTGGPTVLHLGSEPVAVSRALAVLDEKKVTCVVSDDEALGRAEGAGLETYVADLEAPGWHAPLQARTYEVVILADALEHLRDPARVLRDLREQQFVAGDGMLVVSIANAAHEAILTGLLRGDFSRIRWYTASSLTQLLAACGYIVTETHGRYRSAPQAPGAASDEAAPTDYVLQVRPSAAGPQLALLRARLDDATQRLAEAEARSRDLSALVEEERAAFREEIGRGADELARLQAQVVRLQDETGRLRGELPPLRDEIERLQGELAVAREARKATLLRLKTIQRSRSYRWSRKLGRSVGVVIAPVLAIWQRARARR